MQRIGYQAVTISHAVFWWQYYQAVDVENFDLYRALLKKGLIPKLASFHVSLLVLLLGGNWSVAFSMYLLLELFWREHCALLKGVNAQLLQLRAN